MVTVYSKPNCVQCDRTYYVLEKEGIPFKTIDVTQDPAAHAKVTELGYMQAPVVVTEDQHWSGFRPDLIKALKPAAPAAV